MNYQPNITAFDKDNSLIAGLGEEMEDLVIKSRELDSGMRSVCLSIVSLLLKVLYMLKKYT